MQQKPLAQKFGDIIYEFRANCWLNFVAWNKSGYWGYVAGQNATIAVINYKDKKTDLIKCKHSPVILLYLLGKVHFWLFVMIEIF